MTKAAAMHSFWASFGLPAFEENSVPAGDRAPDFPYITYELITDAFGGETAMTASVWYRSPSWLEANAKAEQIGDSIGYAGKVINADGGYIWIMRGSPFARSMGDDNDALIKRKIINITAAFYTAK